MAKAKKITKTQTVFIIIGAVLFAICAGLIGWYAYISLHGEQKMTATDVTINKLTTAEGETANIIEVDYHSNAAKNGLECLDIKWNYLSDDSHTTLYSQGLQYVANNSESSIEFFTVKDLQNAYNESSSVEEYKSFVQQANDSGSIVGGQVVCSTGWWFWKTEYKTYYFSPFVNEEYSSSYNYMGEYGEASLGSTNPLGNDTRFTITTTNADKSQTSFYMMFKGGSWKNFPSGISTSEFMKDEGRKAQIDTCNIYDYYTPDFVSQLIYESVKTLPAGTDAEMYFEFGDYFNYYKVAEDGKAVGELLNKEDSTNLVNHIKSYYSIKVTVHADGVRNASDSMFGVVHGSSSFTLDVGSQESGEYFMGRQIINCNTNIFDIVEVADGFAALKLKKSFIETYKPSANKIYLSIQIDLDQISAKGYEFVGFTKDAGLGDFEILSFTSSETLNGQQVIKGVTYA